MNNPASDIKTWEVKHNGKLVLFFVASAMVAFAMIFAGLTRGNNGGHIDLVPGRSISGSIRITDILIFGAFIFIFVFSIGHTTVRYLRKKKVPRSISIDRDAQKIHIRFSENMAMQN